MSKVTVTEFTVEHVADAARALSRRHARHRSHSPFLPDGVDFERHVSEALDGGAGAIATRDGHVVGYLLGTLTEDPVGPCVMSHVAGQAVDEPDAVRDLYAVAAARWVDEGRMRHFIFVPALPELIEPWFRLSFGASAALAARRADLPMRDGHVAVTVRRSTAADAPDLAVLEHTMYVDLTQSPSFSGLTVDALSVFEEEWRGIEDDARFTHFVGELDGSIVCQVLLFRRPAGDLRVPSRSIDLASVTTSRSARGHGVATATAAAAIRWAAANDFDTIITDWRMSNVNAARLWPSLGFDETFLRLYRSIP